MLTLLFQHFNQNELKHTNMLKTIFSINPLTHKSDWLPIFPHSIPLEQNVEVMRIKEMIINLGISWKSNKLSASVTEERSRKCIYCYSNDYNIPSCSGQSACLIFLFSLILGDVTLFIYLIWSFLFFLIFFSIIILQPWHNITKHHFQLPFPSTIC